MTSKDDIAASLASARAAGRRVFVHTYAQAGGEYDPRDLTAGETGLLGKSGLFIPYRQVAMLYPAEPAKRRKKESE